MNLTHNDKTAPLPFQFNGGLPFSKRGTEVTAFVGMNITKSIVFERDRALIGGDYSSYQAQTTRRIHTIRRRLGVTTPRGRKFTPRSAVTAQNVAKNTESVRCRKVLPV